MRKHYIGFCLFFLLAITGCKDPEKARAFIENATREAKILNAKYCAEENAHCAKFLLPRYDHKFRFILMVDIVK